MSVHENENDLRATGLLTPKKVVIQLLGFAVGIVLLVLIIRNAAGKGDWSRLRHADPWLIAGMLGCTALSALFNGTTFWISIRSIKPLRFRDMQALNLVAYMLNYGPVRLGAIARVLYHLRVDRLGVLEVGAWFAVISYVLLLGVGASIVATLAHPEIDLVWAAMFAGMMILGGLVTRMATGIPLLSRYGGGVDRILADRGAVWTLIALRVLDLATYVGRMALAVEILGIELSTANTIILAIVALSASLIPFGRLGFREYCVAAAAGWLSMQTSDLEQNMDQLALIESAGEMAFFIPLGAIGLFWFRKRWRSAKADTPR